MAGAKNSKASRATSRRKLPPRAARKKRVLEEPTSAKVNPKSMARNKIKIADLSEERQIVVRKQNQIATAKKRLQGGEDLKVAENKSAVDRYVMKTVIPKVNSLLKGGILAWRTETSCSVVKNKDLLHMVQMMETEVPRSKLFHLQFTKKKQEERYQAVISAFDEAGRCLDYSSKRSKDKKLWLSKSQSQKLKQQIEKDYLHATGFTSMADAKIYIREVGLVYGGNTLQRVHNDDHTDDFPDGWEQRHSIAAESGTILYGLKDDKDNRCTIHFAEDNEVGRLKKVRVYGGMAVFYAGWVYHAGADHGGRNGSTRMYVDINEMP